MISDLNHQHRLHLLLQDSEVTLDQNHRLLTKVSSPVDGLEILQTICDSVQKEKVEITAKQVTDQDFGQESD